MSITSKNAYIGQPGTSDTTVYTCPDNTTAIIKKCTATNDTTTAVTLTAYKVPSEDSVGDDVMILNGKAIGSKDTYECPSLVGKVLDAGDVLSMKASIASQLTVDLDVTEIV